MKIWGLSRSTVWPSGTHCATCCINVGRGMVVWFLTRNSILYCNYLSPREIIAENDWTTLNLQSPWCSKKSLKVCRQSVCISGRLAIQVPETGTRRCVYLRKFISGIWTRSMIVGNWAHWPCSRNACGFNGFYIFNHQLNGINWRFTRYKKNLCRALRLRKKTWRWSKFIPQGVFVWQFAIFKIRGNDWKKKKEADTYKTFEQGSEI